MRMVVRGPMLLLFISTPCTRADSCADEWGSKCLGLTPDACEDDWVQNKCAVTCHACLPSPDSADLAQSELGTSGQTIATVKGLESGFDWRHFREIGVKPTESGMLAVTSRQSQHYGTSWLGTDALLTVTTSVTDERGQTHEFLPHSLLSTAGLRLCSDEHGLSYTGDRHLFQASLSTRSHTCTHMCAHASTPAYMPSRSLELMQGCARKEVERVKRAHATQYALLISTVRSMAKAGRSLSLSLDTKLGLLTDLMHTVGTSVGEGHVGTVGHKQKRENLAALASSGDVDSYVEVGFNCGHSLTIMLHSAPSLARVVVFDIGWYDRF